MNVSHVAIYPSVLCAVILCCTGENGGRLCPKGTVPVQTGSIDIICIDQSSADMKPYFLTPVLVTKNLLLKYLPKGRSIDELGQFEETYRGNKVYNVVIKLDNVKVKSQGDCLKVILGEIDQMDDTTIYFTSYNTKVRCEKLGNSKLAYLLVKDFILSVDNLFTKDWFK